MAFDIVSILPERSTVSFLTFTCSRLLVHTLVHGACCDELLTSGIHICRLEENASERTWQFPSGDANVDVLYE